MNQEQEIFEQAVALPSREAREAYLDNACGPNRGLRRSVDALLGAFDDAGDLNFLPTAGRPVEAPTVLADARPDEGPGTVIGRYKLLQQIGEGGMGVVYMAEQEEPVRRRVALKIIKLGMDTKSVIARFEAERQALAMMDHPNIAKVFDAGTTGEPNRRTGEPAEGRIGELASRRADDSPIRPLAHSPSPPPAGRPYFVMELVRGTKITEYCDEARLSTRARLDLFIQVCQAIQHAHQKGIIHRDIKPSNILVTVNDGVAVPKVIDFGIAKATEGRLTDKTLVTQFEALLGTPAYMSPEQAVMTSLDIDTRSDIYSLGVLLYELLAGSTPFDAKELLASGIDAMRQTIREQEPARPSTRLATLPGEELTTTAKRRSSDTSRLIHQLQGDLDWIVMKCLEKDRSRRYETANGLVADLKRHLNNEPVVARPPTAAYRFQKLVQRNKLAFAAVTGVAAALLLGVVVSTWQWVRAARASASEAVQHQLADMQLALQAWEEGDLQRAKDLIEASRPAPGQVPGFEWRYLSKLCKDQSIETFGDHNRQYRSARFFDRDLLLLNDEKTLTLRDLSLARRKDQLLLDDPDGIWNFALCSGNTNLLATVTDNGRIKVWDLAGSRVRVAWEGHPRSPTATTNSPFSTLTFSRDGRWLASAVSDDSIKLWDVEAGNPKPARIVHRYSSWGCGVVFTPDAAHLFSSGNETQVRRWDVATGAEAGPPLEGHTAWVYALAISPDGVHFASGGADSTVLVRDLHSRQPETKLLGHSAAITALAFSPDGRILASGGHDRTIRLWDLRSGKQVSLLRGHESRIYGLSFSPDGRSLVSQSRDGLVKTWRTTPGSDGSTLVGGRHFLSDMALSPDGRRLATVAVDSFAVDLWDLSTRRRVPLTGHTGAVMCAGFSPDGRILATGSHDQTVRLWDASDHRAIATFTNGFPVGSLSFSPDGRTLLVGGSQLYFLLGDRSGLQFWDVSSLQTIGTLPGGGSDVVEVAWSANRSLLATGHKDGHVSLWDAPTRRPLHRFAGQPGSAVVSLAFSPIQPLLAAGDWWGGNIAIYNTTTMEAIRPPTKAHTWRVMSLAFSPDGRTLASAGEGGGVKLWHVATGLLALTLKGHVGAVTGIAFSQDGNLLASCGADATVRLWPAVTVEEADVGATRKTKGR